MSLKNFTLFITLVLVSLKSFSQSKYNLYLGTGVCQIQGDLSYKRTPQLNTLKPSFTFGFNYNINKIFTIAIHSTYGDFFGSDSFTDDPEKISRGAVYESKIIDGGINLKYHFKSKKKQDLKTYIYSGINYMNLSSKVDFGNTFIPTPEKNYNPNSFNIPIGIGIGFKINYLFNILLETSFYYTNNDYLDGISLNANKDSNDYYWNSHIILAYKFGKLIQKSNFEQNKSKSLNCPKF